MIGAAMRALSQLFDRRMLGILALSLGSSALILIALWFGIGAALDHVRLFDSGWLDWLGRAIIGVGAVFGTALLFGVIVATIAGLFVERIARVVERRYYPNAPKPRDQPLGEQLAGGVSFLLGAVAINILVLPGYLIWGANIPLFLLANGYLLGREYFELVALRRVDRRTMAALRRRHMVPLLLAGATIAGLSFLPLANLLTPVFATAFMLHIFQSLPEIDRRPE